MGRMSIWFDEEGDVFEIITDSSKKGYYKDIGDDVWERVDENGISIGFLVLNFKKRFEEKRSFELPFEINIKEVEIEE
ncbi:MAG: hypothetical protein ACE5KE_08360 [Methanosarcinales archaeon]